jgi:hypothetical protein
LILTFRARRQILLVNICDKLLNCYGIIWH